MQRGTATIAVLLLALSFLFAMAGVACAIPANAAIVSSAEQSISGAEIASHVLKNLDGIALGSESATVTMDIDGAPHDVAIDLGELAAGGSVKSGLGGLTVIAAIAAGLFKGAAMLVRALR
ncbi:MAG: hypothetical protein CVT59_10105 [Actinobacteria bacterium HGW-Actinobacteria-1]|jgi:hypothetical protein|nr:MAG: hypothetical protein CVT59_10105 [Actinobacteria bacterium HGW-Actinobacteria-1]